MSTETITVDLIGGPLDGEQLTYDLTDLEADRTQWGAHLIVNGVKAHPLDPGARAIYEPVPLGVVTQWHFTGWG